MEEVESTAEYAKYTKEFHFSAYSAYFAVRIFFLPVVSFQLFCFSAFQLFSFQLSAFSFSGLSHPCHP